MLRSVRFYSVSSPWPDSELALSEKLAGAAFKPCGAYTERSSGFEPPTGSEDAPLARRVAGVDLLRLRNQTRVLPTAAVNEALEVRLAEYRNRMQEEPGRRTKRKLKEQTRDELLPKALLKSDRTAALFLLNENVLAIGTGSETRAERFLELLRLGVGKLDAEPIQFARPVENVLQRVLAGDPPPRFTLGREARMRDRADAKGSVRWSEIDLTNANVRRCIKDGMELTHLGLQFDGALQAVLDSKGALSKLKLVGLDEAAEEAAEGVEAPENPLVRLDAELALLGGMLRQLIVGLRGALGG
jgi:recombination associated protein RdgC